ncbi:MAG: radical SAM protein [Alphaproteobacteria bacterium]|nr:radical SAM protein [Alphaproteobacteria bacterium]
MRVLLVVYDNGAYMHHFPMGLGYIAAILEREGYEVDVYSQDMHHYPDEHLTEFLDANHYDVVCISLIAGYYQYQRLVGLSKAINDTKDRPFYILGGYGPTPEPEYFMQVSGADCIVMGEGEETAVELFDAIANKRPLSLISGIAYNDNGKCVINPRRGVVEDLDSIPWPAYHLFPMEYYRLLKRPGQPDTEFTLPMMSARGCTFKCTFCYRMDPGYRARSGEDLLAEVEFLYKEYGVTRISFMDDLMMTSIAHTEEICNAFEKANLPVTWDCNGRLNYCTPELLAHMKRAGCVFINYGIEAMDDNVLKLMKKGLRTEQVVKGVEWTLEAGISPGLNMLFGNLGDTKETLQKAVDFLIKYDDQAQRRTIRPVTPYPGSPLYHMAIEQGLLEGPADFYERKHLNSDLLCCNFTELSDDEVYAALEDANKQLAMNYFDSNREKALAQIEHLYREKDTTFRGFRQGAKSQGMSKPAAALSFGAVASDSM